MMSSRRSFVLCRKLRYIIILVRMNFQLFENSEECLNFPQPYQYQYDHQQIFSNFDSRDQEQILNNENPSDNFKFEKDDEGTGQGLNPIDFIDTLQIQGVEVTHFNTSIQKPSKLTTLHKQQVETQVIEISMQKMFQRGKCLKGDRLETKNISKHLQSQTANFLKLLATTKQLSKQQLLDMKIFMSQKVGLENFESLFKRENIRRKCRQFFESKFFVRNIMSARMTVKSKIILLKYLEKMRKTTCEKTRKWKD